MADGGQIERLKDVAAWNAWCQENRDERPDLFEANLSWANLNEANLNRATLVGTDLDGANLASAQVFGVSVWGVTGIPAAQTDLIITEDGEAEITVDDDALNESTRALGLPQH